MEQADKDWDEILAALRPICEEPTEDEEQLCAACSIRPTHADCIYCADCCAEGK